MKTDLFIVLLRRPGKNDGRSDPYWEFGSFGCTGCHDDNLLNPQKQHVKAGDRLTFVQGGDQGCKLLLITPPVERVQHGAGRVELRWDKAARPFRYTSDHAPVLARQGMRNVALVELGKEVNSKRRSTAEGKFASCFRSRSQPVDAEVAEELMEFFAQALRAATDSDFIRAYTDALPWPITAPLSLAERRAEYQNRLAELNRIPGRSCHPRSKSCN